jgi:hypothetical protein
MAKQTINLGNIVNDGTGDALRVGAQKINANFTELYNLLGGNNIQIVSSITAGPGLVASSSSGEVTITAQLASADTAGVVKIGSGVSIDADGVLSTPAYVLPRAATNILGGIRVGNNLSINNEGVLSADAQNYSLPTASTSTLGGIKIGSGLTITDGIVNVVTSDIASALVSGPVTISLEDIASAGVLTASGALSIVTKDPSNYLKLQHTLDNATPNVRNVLEVNNTGVDITSYSATNEILSQWTFGSDGNFDASNHSITARNINADNGNISLGPDFGLIFTQGDGAIVAVDKTWTFNTDGDLILPVNGDILNSEGDSVLLPTIIDTLTNGNFEVSLSDTGDLTVPGVIGSLTAISLSSGTDTSITAGTDLKLFADGLFALRNYSTEDSIAITVNFNDVSQRSWLFNNNGSITFPNNTVQTTAYVSNITTESDDNSSILIPGSTMSRGSLTVRVTVVNDAELSVEINYVEPNNTVKISGSNGTTNLFNGSIDVIPGNVIYYPITTTPLTQVGDIVTAIIADHSFGKMYRITAIYRDIPTESTTASVYCTIEQLI